MASLNIIIADPDTAQIKFIFNYLNRYADYQIYSAKNLDTVFQIKDRGDIDLILLAWEMIFPLDVAASHLIDEISPDNHPPLFLISSPEEHFGDEKKEIYKRVNDFLCRPLNLSDLKTKIDDLILNRENQLASSGKNAVADKEILSNTRQKEILHFEKERIEAEKKSLNRIRKDLDAELKKLEDQKLEIRKEKEALDEERAKFKIEEKQVFDARMKLLEDQKELQHERNRLNQLLKEANDLKQKNETEKKKLAKERKQAARPKEKLSESQAKSGS